MNATCTSCQTVFRVDPAKVPVVGVRARCSVCNGVFWVRASEPSVAASPRPTVTAVAPPVRPPIEAPPDPSSAPPAAPPAPRPAAPPAQAPARNLVPPPRTPVAPAFAPPAGVSTPAAPPRFAGLPASFAAGVAPLPAPPARPVAKPRANPFMSQDPAAKARRLARALISDMVVYHPAKRREGLQNGSLKSLFGEEIKKSWEEYVDQVGLQTAESTAFFHDALNEILADGRTIFP